MTNNFIEKYGGMENKLKNRFKRVYLKAGQLLTENIWVLLMFLFLYATRNYFGPLIFNSFIGSILSSFEENSIITTFFFLLIGISINIWFWKLSSQSFQIPFKIYLICFGVILLYMVFRINFEIINGAKIYYTRSAITLITYVDILLLFAIIGLSIIIIRGYYAKKNVKKNLEEYIKGKNSLSFDNPIEYEKDDSLGYKILAEEIVGHILSLKKTEKSFTIGLSGPWGIGKTSVLNLIENRLKLLHDEKKSDHILISFSPMLLSHSNTLTIEFLNQLKYQLSKYSLVGGSEMSTYIYFLTRKVNDFWSGLMAILSGSKSSQAQLKDIGKLIKSIDRRIIVLIDDLDRLEKEEIIEVLRLMRNIANLPNMVYLVAMDKGYLIEKLDESVPFINPPYPKDEKVTLNENKKPPNELDNNNNSINNKHNVIFVNKGNAEKYLEKYFNVEYSLPRIKPSYITEEIIIETKTLAPQLLSNVIKLLGVSESSSLKTTKKSLSHYPKYSEFVLHCIKNKRDLKRYLNSLMLIPSSHLNDLELDSQKILVLELLKLKYFWLFQAIQTANLLYDEVSTSSKRLDTIKCDEIITEYYQSDKQILTNTYWNIFELGTFDSPTLISINNPERFDIYFNHFSRTFVSINQLEKFRYSDHSKYFSEIKRISEEGDSNKKQIIQYLLSIKSFSSFKDFKNVISAMLGFESFVDFHSSKIIEIVTMFFRENESKQPTIKNFFKEVIKDSIPLGVGYGFFLNLYDYLKLGENNLPLDESELKDICFERLKSFTENNKRGIEKCNNLYFACRDKVENNTVILQEKAHPLRLNYIHKQSWEFINSLIRPYGVPIYVRSYNFFTIDPFTEDTFGSWAIFWEFINDFRKTEEYNKNKVRFEKYYLFLKDFEQNGHKSLKVRPEDLSKYGIYELIKENEWMVVDY